MNTDLYITIKDIENILGVSIATAKRRMGLYKSIVGADCRKLTIFDFAKCEDIPLSVIQERLGRTYSHNVTESINMYQSGSIRLKMAQ